MAVQGDGGLTAAALSLPLLYGITDPRGARRLSAPDAARLLLDGGIRFVQARLKSGSALERLALVRAVVELARARSARVVVNDRGDLALLSGADGVHLGDEDLPAEAGRRLLGPAAIVGVSTHTVEALRAAMDDPDCTYVALGPIFATNSKEQAHPVLGVSALEEAARLKSKPLVAIGGVRPEDVGECLSRGADAVAMIAGLLDGDVAGNVRRALASAERAGFRA